MAGGRPTKYKPEFAEQARKLCDVMAATDAELAQFFGVASRTIDLWKVTQPEFMQAISEGKGPANLRVKQSLYKLATGFTYTETEHKVVGGKLVKIESEKYVPPNPVAQGFWLKNREPDQWRDKQELEVDLRGNLAESLARARRRAVGDSDAEE